ncbi:unnamed protein product [Polarella glacialis]|uniref:Uncharacterized protein n=1 Tax=Polarella glacialis TaxID=89957 RepID=A0A813G630_POLGL|nr:unnamed protein product [Polarella glacialis]
MKAEKKLQALNSLPNSGAEPKDGIVQGTPLWQERLDQMLLVEHLKKKVMVGHTAFTEATELLVEAHTWLVKDSMLADTFALCVARVPASQHDRMDMLQNALKKTAGDLKIARGEFHDYKVLKETQRQAWIQRTVDHQAIAIRQRRKDDIMMAFRYRVQQDRSNDLEGANYALVTRVYSLEAAMMSGQEHLEEASRQWDEQKAALTAERNEFRRLYEKFLKAHEQAMADLEESQGTAEDQAKMLQVLSVEKHRLTGEVEDLTAQKKAMVKQLADLRDEVAKLKAEMRRLGAQCREGEQATLAARSEAQTLRADVRGLEDILPAEGKGPGRPSLRRKLQQCALREAQLLDLLQVATLAAAAMRRRLEPVEGAKGQDKSGMLPPARKLRADMERERDEILAYAREKEAEAARVKLEAQKTVLGIKTKCDKDLHDFKTVGLAKITADFEAQITSLTKKNNILMAEVAVGDAIGPHLPTLNPLPSGEEDGHDKVYCSSCRRAIVFEGPTHS